MINSVAPFQRCTHSGREADGDGPDLCLFFLLATALPVPVMLPGHFFLVSIQNLVLVKYN